VSVEDATDEKSQRQPRKRKRNSSGSEDMEGAQYRGGDTQGIVMLELHFVLLSRSTDFYRTMLRRERLCHNISSVCLSVTSRYRDNIGWNTSKIISRLNSLGLRYLFGLTQRRRSGATGTPTKLGWNGCGVISTKICGISETVQNMTNVTKKDQRPTGSCIYAFDWYQNQ